MKKLIYLVSICLAMTATSCDDFLTVSSPDEVTTGNFWKSESEIQATMASVYAQLYHGDAWATSEVRYPVEEYRSDLFYPGEDAINYQNWTDIYKFTYTNGNTQFSYYYKDLYRGINFANQILEYAPQVPEGNISEEKRAELIAEAHFMRGYYHFMLLMNWEKIIIRNKYLSDQADLNKPLSDRIACWEFVIDELQKGTALPATRTNAETGRATKDTAYSYLGFAYLTRAYEEPSAKDAHLTESLKALNEVKGYELVSGDDLVNMFNGHNKNCKESIFEVQFSSSTENGARYYSQMHYFILSNRTGGWDEILPDAKLVNEFKKEGKTSLSGMYDERLYNTLFFKDDFWNDGTGKIYGNDYADLHWQWLTNTDGKYVDANGNVISEFNTTHTEVISEKAYAKILSMLLNVVDGGTGNRVRRAPYNITAQMGGKTGTTNYNADGWFMGFTPELVSGVWVGGDERYIHFNTMAHGQGAAMALPIYGLYMSKVYADPKLPYSQNAKFEVDFSNLCDKEFYDYIEESDDVEESIADVFD